MKNFIYVLLWISLLMGCDNNKRPPLYKYPLSAVDIKDVQLTDKFWLPRIKMIQQTTIPYSFDKCRTEGRMDNFLIAGGKMKGETKGHNPFDDTDVYKIIEGASYSLITSPNKTLSAYLDSLIDIIRIGQEKDGYLTTWMTINPLKPPASYVKVIGRRWEGEAFFSHELYNCGHLYEAASAHYHATGKRNFLGIALKNADLLVSTLGPGGKQSGYPGHQIVETGLIKLYQITGKVEYLDLAKRFLDRRGRWGKNIKEDLNSVGVPTLTYSQDRVPVTEQDEVVGHAVRAVYMYAGMSDVATLYGDNKYRAAVDRLWENMVNKKMYITGGLGARHAGESFGNNYELPNLTGYGETCAAIGSVFWNQRLFLSSGDAKYNDIIERTLYNGALPGISLDGTKFYYCNPMESNNNFKFNFGSCMRKPWFDVSCCPTSLIRFIPSIPNLIYGVQKDTLYVNQFISNKASITLDNHSVQVIQQTDYPWVGRVTILINPGVRKKFTIKIRIPGWARNQPVPGTLYNYLEAYSGNVSLKINGEAREWIYNKGYMEVTKEWSESNQIEVEFPMEVHRVLSNDLVKGNKNRVALEYGPIVYCMEEIDNPVPFDKLFVGDNQKVSVTWKNELLDGVNIITVGSGENGNLVFVPYYSWMNRGPGKMKIWLPRERLR